MINTRTLLNAYVKHRDCEVVVYHKKFSNGDVVPGLYCKAYGTWIQWLDIKTADDLILSGIEIVLEQPKKIKRHPVPWKTKILPRGGWR
jgi:hypothetical protein